MSSAFATGENSSSRSASNAEAPALSVASTVSEPPPSTARAYAAISHHKGSAAQIDAATLQRPKRLFGAARAVEGGGSLTVLATLSAGASAFDALLLDEFSPVANAELILARELAEVRAYPPVDLMRSGNWYEEQLLSEIALHKVTDLRRALSGVASVEASERIYAALARTKSNDEFVTALDLKKV